jgi:hypothetical protein
VLARGPWLSAPKWGGAVIDLISQRWMPSQTKTSRNNTHASTLGQGNGLQLQPAGTTSRPVFSPHPSPKRHRSPDHFTLVLLVSLSTTVIAQLFFVVPPFLPQPGPWVLSTMGRRGYRPWSHAEEDNLEEWVAQHLDLTWDERAEKYSQTVCPRSSESLRSKLRQIKRDIRRRRALHMRHLQRRRDVVAKVVGRRQQTALAPSRSGPCPRYVPSRQIYDRPHELPLARGHPANRKALSVHEKAASRLLDKFHSVKKPRAYKGMDHTPPQSKSEAT